MIHSLKRSLVAVAYLVVVAAAVIVVIAGPARTAGWFARIPRWSDPMPLYGRLEMPLEDGTVCVVDIPQGASLADYRLAVAHGCAR